MKPAYIVYPGHGVAKVRGVTEKRVNGKVNKYITCSVVSSGLSLIIPLDKTKELGVRSILTKEQADAVLRDIQYRDVTVDNTTWNRRYRDFMEKINSGDVNEVVYVYLALKKMRTQKDMSFGERKMLESVKNILNTELSIATDSVINLE